MGNAPSNFYQDFERTGEKRCSSHPDITRSSSTEPVSSCNLQGYPDLLFPDEKNHRIQMAGAWAWTRPPSSSFQTGNYSNCQNTSPYQHRRAASLDCAVQVDPTELPPECERIKTDEPNFAEEPRLSKTALKKIQTKLVEHSQLTNNYCENVSGFILSPQQRLPTGVDKELLTSHRRPYIKHGDEAENLNESRRISETKLKTKSFLGSDPVFKNNVSSLVLEKYQQPESEFQTEPPSSFIKTEGILNCQSAVEVAAQFRECPGTLGNPFSSDSPLVVEEFPYELNNSPTDYDEAQIFHLQNSVEENIATQFYKCLGSPVNPFDSDSSCNELKVIENHKVERVFDDPQKISSFSNFQNRKFGDESCVKPKLLHSGGNASKDLQKEQTAEDKSEVNRKHWSSGNVCVITCNNNANNSIAQTTHLNQQAEYHLSDSKEENSCTSLQQCNSSDKRNTKVQDSSNSHQDTHHLSVFKERELDEFSLSSMVGDSDLVSLVNSVGHIQKQLSKVESQLKRQNSLSISDNYRVQAHLDMVVETINDTLLHIADL